MKVLVIGSSPLTHALCQYLGEDNLVTLLSLFNVNKIQSSSFKVGAKSISSMEKKEINFHLLSVDLLIFAEASLMEIPMKDYPRYLTAVDDFLRLVKLSKIKKVVMISSILAHFGRSNIALANDNGYINLKIEEEKKFRTLTEEDIDVSILEVPVVFGLPCESSFILSAMRELIVKFKKATFVVAGGKSFITLSQLCKAVLNAKEFTQGAITYPLGSFNLTYIELGEKLNVLFKVERKVMKVPVTFAKMFLLFRGKKENAHLMSYGLNSSSLVKLISTTTYIDEGYYDHVIEEDSLQKALEASFVSVPQKKLVKQR